MSVPSPHFHLYSEARVPAPCAAGSAASDSACSAGTWRFAIRSSAGEMTLEAADTEEGASAERLELLAIVRGLEALDQPSRVTLITPQRSIQHGLEAGLAEWRQNDWQWERYGKMTPIKNRDLWQRIDRLLEIHSVECRPRGRAIADDLASARAEARRPSAGSPARHLRKGGQSFRIDHPAASPPCRPAGRHERIPAPVAWFTQLLHGLRSRCLGA